MNETNVLLHAYYEALHEALQTNRGTLIAKVEKLLAAEIEKRGFGSFNEEKFAAYRDACVAFIDERIETYNPIGVQYTFDRPTAHQARELELQLNWYDSRAEFETDERLRELAVEVISQVGAYPDNTIISAFEAEPALSKLPDYVVARAIEETVR
ncbi:MAG: hypothetical protein ACYS6I_02760 [Planctomycetota bacterium]|jgi:hypothetical protein